MKKKKKDPSDASYRMKPADIQYPMDHDPGDPRV